jgi:serine/threonine-protein kinase PknK
MNPDGIRVVLADDDVLLREGIASMLIRNGMDVVGQAGDAGRLLELTRQLRPDLVVTDIRMPPQHRTEGLDAAKTIRAEFPEISVLLLSAHIEVEHAMDLLASGERIGYLLKGRVTEADDFIASIRRVSSGGQVIDPALVRELVVATRADDPLDALSTREREVLALMAEGRSNAGIAKQIWITEGTVEKHVRSIFMKLGITGTQDDHRRVLAVLAYLETR